MNVGARSGGGVFSWHYRGPIIIQNASKMMNMRIVPINNSIMVLVMVIQRLIDYGQEGLGVGAQRSMVDGPTTKDVNKQIP